MASGGFKSNKPELIAIYRLEFYKNKKKWKFSNERKKESLQPPCEPPQTKSTQNLNKTYDVEPSYDSEKETSPLNNAFMHEIPTDDTPEEVPSAPPPTPQPPKEIGQHLGTEPGPRLSNTDIWVNSGVLTGSETCQEAQTTEIAEDTDCRTDAVQQSLLAPCINQNQPANNLQSLVQTNPVSAYNQPKIEPWRPKTDFWSNDQAAGPKSLRTQQSWSNQTSEIDNSSCIPKNIWTSAASSINPELFHQNSLSTPTSATPLPDTGMLASLLKRQGLNLPCQKDGTIPQAPPANCLQMLLCPDKWKKQAKTVPHQNDQSNSHNKNPGLWTNPALATDPTLLQNQKHNNKPNANPDSWTNQVQSTPPPFSKRLNPDIWLHHQNTPQNFPLDSQNSSQCVSQVSFTNQRSVASPQNLAKPVHKSLMSHQDPEIKGPLLSPEKYPADTMCEPQKAPNTWTNPALSSNPEAMQQYVWRNQARQKQEVLCQNSDQERAPAAEDVPDAECNEDLHPVDLQYIEVDQNTLKPQGSPNSEMLTPEQIRRSTDEWLRRLLALYRSKEDCNDLETASDHNQGGLNDSTDFIREAHEVPHSSEKDPNETRECVCSYLPSCSLPALSSRRLSAALQHATKVLRDVLREQLIRDRLRSLTLLNVVEYPTRDTDLFGSEYVMGGSHVPHCTRDLTRPQRPPGGERVIKIDMGRPYRL